MRYSRKEVGDAVGALFAVAVDACKSHHEAHAVEPASPGHLTRRTGSEIGSATATVSQRCAPSWTGNAGETVVAVEAAGTTMLAPANMAMLVAGQVMSTQTQPGDPYPNQLSAGTHSVKVAINSGSPRGLHVGWLRSASGVALSEPVLIYMDEVL